MKLEPCIGCGRHVLCQPIANLVVKCDPTPLTDVGEIVGLLTSPNPPSLWMVENGRLRGARPGEPGPVREHRCTNRGTENAVAARLATSPVGGPPDGRATPPKACVAPSRPSSGQPTGYGAPAARPTDATRSRECSLCGHPVELADVESYVMIELGATVVDVFHTGTCPTRR